MKIWGGVRAFCAQIKREQAMAVMRFTEQNDNIILGGDGTFLGEGGDDAYILDPNLIPDNASMAIADNEGANIIRLPDGVEIESSIVATLSDGGVAIQLTLMNGTTLFIDRADTFGFQVGGDTGGNGSTSQTITEFVEDTLGTIIPAPGGSSQGGSVSIDVNLPPEAANDDLGTNESSSLTFSSEQLLINDTDDDEDTLSIVSVDDSGLQGVLTDNGDGTYTYDPNGQFDDLQVGESATDTFSYTVSDGNGGTDTATVTVTVSGQDQAQNSVMIDGPGSYFATQGADVFTILIDNDSVQGGEITNPDFDGEAQVSGFDVAQDVMIFQNVPGSTVDNLNILQEDGVIVLEDPFERELSYIFGDDPGVAGEFGVRLSFENIVEQDKNNDGELDFIEVI